MASLKPNLGRCAFGATPAVDFPGIRGQSVRPRAGAKFLLTPEPQCCRLCPVGGRPASPLPHRLAGWKRVGRRPGKADNIEAPESRETWLQTTTSVGPTPLSSGTPGRRRQLWLPPSRVRRSAEASPELSILRGSAEALQPNSPTRLLRDHATDKGQSTGGGRRAPHPGENSAN